MDDELFAVMSDNAIEKYGLDVSKFSGATLKHILNTAINLENELKNEINRQLNIFCPSALEWYVSALTNSELINNVNYWRRTDYLRTANGEDDEFIYITIDSTLKEGISGIIYMTCCLFFEFNFEDRPASSYNKTIHLDKGVTKEEWHKRIEECKIESIKVLKSLGMCLPDEIPTRF